MKVKIRNTHYKPYKEIEVEELLRDVVLIVLHGHKKEFRKNEKRPGKSYWYFETAFPQNFNGEYIYSTDNKKVDLFDDGDWDIIHEYCKEKGIQYIYSHDLPSEQKEDEKISKYVENKSTLWKFWEDNEEIAAKFTYEEKQRWVDKRLRNFYQSKSRKKSIFHNN